MRKRLGATKFRVVSARNICAVSALLLKFAAAGHAQAPNSTPTPVPTPEYDEPEDGNTWVHGRRPSDAEIARKLKEAAEREKALIEAKKRANEEAEAAWEARQRAEVAEREAASKAAALAKKRAAARAKAERQELQGRYANFKAAVRIGARDWEIAAIWRPNGINRAVHAGLVSEQ